MHNNETSDQQVNRSIAKGALWMLALRFAVKSIGLVSTMILARLLVPDDFGLVALAVSVYSLVELLHAFGFGTALIQKQQATRVHYDTAWTLRIIFSAIGAIVLLLAAYPIARFYDDARLSAVLAMLALAMLVGGMANIGTVDFQKKMLFQREFMLGLMVKAAGFCITIPLAFWLRSYWALLFGMVSGRMASVILSYLMNDYRPRFSLKATRELMDFSVWLMLNNILLFANRHTQNFVLARFAGSSAVGLLSVSNEIASLTTAEIVAPINRAAYPGYAKISSDKELLKNTYLKVLASIVLIATPSALGIAAIAPILVPVLLGSAWLEAVPVIQILAIANVLAAMTTNSGYVYLAMAQQKLTTLLMSIRLIFLFPLLVYFSGEEGVIGAAKALLITQLLVFPIYQSFLKTMLAIRWLDLASVMIRPVTAGLAMAALVSLFVSLFEPQHLDAKGLAVLASAILLGFLVFATVLFSLWLSAGTPQGTEQYVAQQLSRIFKALSRRRRQWFRR